MSIGTAIRSAITAHVGLTQPALVAEGDIQVDTYEEVREVFGTNAEIAEAAGYGAPGQHRKGSAEWKRRRTFMRNLQRYEMGATGGAGQRRTPRARLTELVRVARINVTRRNTPRTVRDVIRLMGMRGTTSFLVRVKFSYEAHRNRVLQARVYTARSVYRDVEWPMRGRVPKDEGEWIELGQQYLEAFSLAYGMPGDLPSEGLEETPVFQFTIGRDESEGSIDYEYA